MTTTDKMYILSQNLEMNSLESKERIYIYVALALRGMWGSSQFGSTGILGEGSLYSYISSTEKHTLSRDDTINMLHAPAIVQLNIVNVRAGMWGESMFGSAGVLGIGSLYRYLSNSEKHTMNTDNTINVLHTPTTLYLNIMSTRAGMWGESMFGVSSLLGTGTLNIQTG